LLAPSSASARLLGLAASIDLTGISTVSLPYVGATGRPPVPFIPEGSPGPVVALNVSATTLGPARKMLILAALTRETQDASAQTAETLIGSALATSAEQSLDAALFSSNAASDSAPPGLLHDVTPIASAGTTGAPGIADDLGLLADAISKPGIGIDDAVFIATAKLATKLRVLASPKFTNEVLSSAALADGEVVAVVPRGLATGYSDGAVSVEVSNAPIGVAW
jgi:hypothetical protein